MQQLIALGAIVAVAALSPGPNNFIVMGAAARGGPSGALPAVAGVLSGSLALLAAVWAGAAAVFASVPGLSGVLLIAGSAYLAALGGAMILSAGKRSVASGKDGGRGLPAGYATVAAFQLINPKGWTLILTAVAAVDGAFAGTWSLVVLIAVFVAIPLPSLMVWSVAGALFARWLQSQRARRLFDAVMGALLLGSAVSLAVSGLAR